MKLKGGVITMGSLFWDEDPKRVLWRKRDLEDLSEKSPVRLKIRYGRKSGTRENTYTMIFSNGPSTGFGQGYILGFNNVIDSFEKLEDYAFSLANAEGIWKTKPSLNAPKWGAVGLILNPNVDGEKKSDLNSVKEKWTKIYDGYNAYFNPSDYSVSDEKPVININGFLEIEWTNEMEMYDFLLATPVKPTTLHPLTPKEIAEKMIEKGYFEYFEKNVSSGIRTFQDDEIQKILGKQDVL